MNPASHIHRLKTKITTPFYQETRAFYEDIIGFKLVEAWEGETDTGCIYEIATGSHLEIYKGDAAGLSGLSLQFRVENLADFQHSLNGKWPTKGPEDRPWGSKYLFLTDPAGVSLIVFEGEN